MSKTQYFVIYGHMCDLYGLTQMCEQVMELSMVEGVGKLNWALLIFICSL
jgi:hypothetical protein